jgi:cellulose synthase/poly-beta-1,6-N-acetylglucosamine synthase-like glycosyltransferase
MLLFQAWTLVTGVLFLFLAWKTRRFTGKILTLENLPPQFRLTLGQNQRHNAQIWPKVSLVIPACNEGETISAAMDSLLSLDYPNLDIILVNDRSTDETGQIIDQLSEADDRIKAVHVNYLPPGWLGKVNALERGLSFTNSEWILLSDADVHFAPDALKNALVYCMKDSIDFLTAIPDVVTHSPFLQIIIAQLFHQGSMFFKPHRINDPKHRACYGQGAFMLMRRSTYLRSERMEWLKMEVVDDTGLALMMRRAGAKMAAVAGLNQIEIEWYPTIKAFIRGIEKNAFAFSQYNLSLLFGWTALILGIFAGFTVAPILGKSPLIAAFTGVALINYLFAIRGQLNRIMKVRPWIAFVFPISFVVLPMLFLRAALITLKRGGVDWRGTFYGLEELKANQRMKLANLVFAPASAEEMANAQTAEESTVELDAEGY